MGTIEHSLVCFETIPEGKESLRNLCSQSNSDNVDHSNNKNKNTSNASNEVDEVYFSLSDKVLS